MMVDYTKAFTTPFFNVRKLFAGTFIILGFGAVMMAGMFAAMLISFGTMLFTQAQPSLGSMLLFYAIYFLAYLVALSMPFAFFVRYGLNAAKKKFEVPSWKEAGLFKEGVQLIVIYTIYGIVLAALYYLISGINPLSIAMTPEAQQAVFANMIKRLPLLLGVMLPLYVLFIYIAPVIFLRFGETKKFARGFEFKAIFKKAFTVKYLLAWLLAVLINIGLSLLMFPIMFLLMITIIGIPFLFLLVMPMFIYVLMLIFFGIVGQAYGEVK